MRRCDVVDDDALGDGRAASRQEVARPPDHCQHPCIERLVLLPQDGDGPLVRPRRDGRGEHVQQDVALLRVEDPEALGHPDVLSVRGLGRRDAVLERGLHAEAIRIGLGQVQGPSSVGV